MTPYEKTALTMIPLTFCFVLFGVFGPIICRAQGHSQRETGISPCEKAKSQMELNECSGEQYRKADARLNVIYSKLLRSMQKDDRARQRLRAAEKAWIQYRDLHCDAAKNQFEGGSIGPTIWANCMTTSTEHRIVELKEAYESPDFKLE